RHLVQLALTAFLVDHRQFAIAGKRQQPAALVLDGRHVAIFDLAVGNRLEMRFLVHLRRAADVEGPHRQLRAWLADRLRGDNADSLTDVDRRTASEIAAIAGRANALLGLADQRAADLGALHFGFLDGLDHRFVVQRAGLGDDFAGLDVYQIFGRCPAEATLAERGNDRTALVNGPRFQRVLGLAVFFRDLAVLRHVDQAAGQVARIRRLERGVGQALAGAVRRVEVFKDGQ